MKITVIGTGYVGLVAGTCFAEMGHQVVCVDVDTQKIRSLQEGHIPIYEPELEGLMISNQRSGRLRFTDSFPDGFGGCEACLIAVGTPPDKNGSADLKNVLEVAGLIGRQLTHYCVIVVKSTVPVGSSEKVLEVIREELHCRKIDIPFDVVSNPEFLKEGDSVRDFMKPDRIIIGTFSERAQKIMLDLYAPFIRNQKPILCLGVREAEMTKYASNAFLATKISFMNEIATLCDHLNVDVEQVRRGIGSDARIGTSSIYPGCGYGGSCFPKDIQALIHIAQEHDFSPLILKAVEDRNKTQKQYLFQKIKAHYNHDVKGKKFAIWGLAFKPETDDLREASSQVLLNTLFEAGASAIAYDPVAMPNAQKEFPSSWFESGQLRFVEHHYDTLPGVDALILITEWKLFRTLDLECMSITMNSKVIFDGRNQFDPHVLSKAGFQYFSVGRPTLPPQ